jgi:hypothetical protein
MIYGDVKVEDIAIQKNPVIWDSMADNLIRTYTVTLESCYSSRGKGMTVSALAINCLVCPEMNLAYITFYASIVAHFIQVIRSDARLHRGSCDIKYFSS